MNEYNSNFTGPEIDAALSRAAAGGGIDAALALKAPLASPALTGTPTINGVPAANVGQLCNPNLLDNWYFGNPVDQRGGYVVPPGKQYYIWGQQTPSGTLTDYATVIGYKGPTPDDSNYYPVVSINEAEYVIYDPGNVNPAVRGYTGVGYGIDRWKYHAHANVLIKDGYIELSTNIASNIYFIQKFEKSLPTGAVFTFSVLEENGTLTSITQKIGDATVNGVLSSGAGFNLDATRAAIFVKNTTASEIKAAKLELGSQQTLAHQDADGNWVLNEIPDYGEQLARCQRYQLVIGQAGKHAPIGIGQARTSTIVSVIVPTPVSLRALPTVKFIAPVLLRNKDAFATIDYSNSRVDIYGPGTVMLNMACTSAIAGAAYDMFCSPGGKIILDANL